MNFLDAFSLVVGVVWVVLSMMYHAFAFARRDYPSAAVNFAATLLASAWLALMISTVA